MNGYLKCVESEYGIVSRAVDQEESQDGFEIRKYTPDLFYDDTIV